jgi:hypothetical protein
MVRANLNRMRRRSAHRGRRYANPLRTTIFLLDGAYASCVTAQLALNQQNADQDSDIALSLRLNVSEPVSRAAEALRAFVGSGNSSHSKESP